MGRSASIGRCLLYRCGVDAETRSPQDPSDDDELMRMVEALQEAGLVEVHEQADGTSAVRLTERGEQVLQQLPEGLQQE